MKTLLCFGLILILTSCGGDLKPEFRSMDGFKIEKVTGKEIILTGNALLFNPAPIGHTIESTTLEVELEGINMGIVEQDIQTKLLAKEETSVPLKLKLNLSNLKGAGWLGKAVSIAASGSADLKLKGKIYVSVKGVKIPLPVDYAEEIYLKDYVE